MFLTSLIITPIKGNEWQLVKPLVYDTGQNVITAPEGFVTDLASIPRPFRLFFPVHGKHTRAAVIHDYLYANQIGKRRDADQIFLGAMKVLGVSWIKRRIFYAAVRIGGAIAWNT